MGLKNFHKIIAETPSDVDDFVEESMDILDRIHELLDKKFGGRQKLLAEKMGKSEAEVSKMLSGVQNFTMKTLIKLQRAFGERIYAVCSDQPQATFIQVKSAHKTGEKQFVISRHRLQADTFDKVPVPSGTRSVGHLIPAGS